MPFYTADQVGRSREVLGRIAATAPSAILIGGWGTWVRLHGEMSHDIDLIVDHAALSSLRSQMGDFSKSSHVGGVKYRGDFDHIHVDLYVPYQSRLGEKLQIKVENLSDHVESLDGYTVLGVEAHMATKIAALLDRPDSLRGEKDRHELAELIRNYRPEPRLVRSCIEQSTTHNIAQLNQLMAQAAYYLSEYEPDPLQGAMSRSERQIVDAFGETMSYPSDFDPTFADVQAEPRVGKLYVDPYMRNGRPVRGYRNPKRGR